MSKFSEPMLLIPSVLIAGKNGGYISTTDLINKLIDFLQPSGEDLQINESRNDTKFSQKVRNIIAHKSLENIGLAIKKDDGIELTSQGKEIYQSFLSQDQSQLNILQSPVPDNSRDLFSAYSPNHTPSQVIFYGVPGCGKSHTIDSTLESVDEFCKMRVVFHPEYTNADFVGQIQPVKKSENISYDFIPGPFSKILKRAYFNPEKHFYLIIEEINRGYAAAIFGDIFQLMDRKNGVSTYPIENDFINDYIRKIEESFKDSKFVKDIPDGEKNDSYYKQIHFEKFDFNFETGIRLPKNLSIIATMNTSDQNVFTLDNAFQRRFDMALIPNELDEKSAQKNAEIAETKITWGTFWKWINEKMMQSDTGMASTEDKRLGAWFIVNQDGKINEKVFAEKVLKYLWDDAFKFKRKDIFDENISSLEMLINEFKKSRFKVFKENDELLRKQGEQQNPQNSDSSDENANELGSNEQTNESNLNENSEQKNSES